jgi:TRAP-type uncharacterized transport system substrate-binding protein
MNAVMQQRVADAIIDALPGRSVDVNFIVSGRTIGSVSRVLASGHVVTFSVKEDKIDG